MHYDAIIIGGRSRALGPMIKVDEMQMTNVSNVFAAGDITRIVHNVTFACAHGVMAAMAIHRSLAFEAAP